jgi:hypothetical protein
LLCSAAAAIWTVDAASNAEPRTVRIIFRTVNLLQARCRETKGHPAPRRLVLQIAIADANYYDPANHEAASKIVGQGNLSA